MDAGLRTEPSQIIDPSPSSTSVDMIVLYHVHSSFARGCENYFKTKPFYALYFRIKDSWREAKGSRFQTRFARLNRRLSLLILLNYLW